MKPYSTPIREYEQAVYVYWLGPNLPTVKIGHTNNPARRLEEFRRETGTPGHKSSFAAIVWLDRHRERVELAVHRRLAAQRRDGEWFSVTAEEALDTIVAIVENMGIRYEIEDRADLTGAIAARQAAEAAAIEAAAAETEAERQRVEPEKDEINLRWNIVGVLCNIIEENSARLGQGQFNMMTDVGLTNVIVSFYREEKFSKAMQFASEFRSAYAYQYQGPAIPRNDVRLNARVAYVNRDPRAVLTQPLCELACAIVAYATERERCVREEAVAKAKSEAWLANCQAAAETKANKERFYNKFVVSAWVLIIVSIGVGLIYLQSDGYKADARAKLETKIQACVEAGGRWGDTGKTTGKYNFPVIGCIRT